MRRHSSGSSVVAVTMVFKALIDCRLVQGCGVSLQRGGITQKLANPDVSATLVYVCISYRWKVATENAPISPSGTKQRLVVVRRPNKYVSGLCLIPRRRQQLRNEAHGGIQMRGCCVYCIVLYVPPTCKSTAVAKLLYCTYVYDKYRRGLRTDVQNADAYSTTRKSGGKMNDKVTKGRGTDRTGLKPSP